MREGFPDFYRREWPRVAAVQAMALGGASLLAGRKNQTNVRALAVMNGMTMCAHQYEEYVDPGYLPGLRVETQRVPGPAADVGLSLLRGSLLVPSSQPEVPSGTWASVTSDRTIPSQPGRCAPSSARIVTSLTDVVARMSLRTRMGSVV